MTTPPTAPEIVGDVEGAAPLAPPRGPSLPSAIGAVLAGQLARARVARGPLLFVATVQSVGILVLMRGVVSPHQRATASAVVAGATVLVVAFVGLNLLAQRIGALKAASALDYYGALPIAPAAFVLGVAGAYAAFTVPGALVTAVVGVLLWGLPAGGIWVVLPVCVAAGLALCGVGAVIGLAMPRPELATVAGQLAMTAILFLGVIPAARFPAGLDVLRHLAPGTLAVDALAAVLHGTGSVGGVAWRLLVTAAYGVVALAVAGRLFRRALDR